MQRWTIVLLLCIAGLAIPYSAAAQKVGGGDLTFSPKGASPVVFSHEQHVKGKGIKCSACHYQIFQMSKGSNKIDMSKITKGSFCGNCHNGQKAFDVKDERNCTRCHK